LDLLDERHVKATFFVLGDRARAHPRVLEETAARGHEIALHGLDHTRLTTLPVAEALNRTARAKTAIEDLVGVTLRWFRPPYGAQSVRLYVGLRRLGLDVIVWGPTARDWVDGSPDEVAARAFTAIRGGDIMLLHDGLELPPGEEMPTFDRVLMIQGVLDRLEERGLRPATIGSLGATSRLRRTAWFRP
jgi:peptidoglycan/xylan/chitin deacetylase (PgdA/CDA1 family)